GVTVAHLFPSATELVGPRRVGHGLGPLIETKTGNDDRAGFAMGDITPGKSRPIGWNGPPAVILHQYVLMMQDLAVGVYGHRVPLIIPIGVLEIGRDDERVRKRGPITGQHLAVAAVPHACARSAACRLAGGASGWAARTTPRRRAGLDFRLLAGFGRDV